MATLAVMTAYLVSRGIPEPYIKAAPSTVVKHVYHDLADIYYYSPWIEESAARHGVEPQILAAIMSRESGAGRLLNPPGPAGTGDNGHGRGLMQIDDRHHKTFVTSGRWRDPAKNIDYGAALLRRYHDRARAAGLDPSLALRAAIAAYNTGASAITDAARGVDPDRTTTGGNYAKDVLARAGLFQAVIKKKSGIGPLIMAFIAGMA